MTPPPSKAKNTFLNFHATTLSHYHLYKQVNKMYDNSKTTTTPPGTTPGPGSGTDSKTRTDAINACKLMDTVLSTPSYHASLFTDSIQLFPDHILQDARLLSSQPNNNQQPQDLNTIMADLQDLLETTRVEINKVLSKVLYTQHQNSRQTTTQLFQYIIPCLSPIRIYQILTPFYLSLIICA